MTATTFSYASVGPNVSATASASSLTGASATHAGNAGYWIPTENEWYKAAYYQPVGAGGPSDSYWLYPTASDSVPTGTRLAWLILEIFNIMEFMREDQNGLPYVSDADGGAYGINSASYYGTFDQGGNVYEWNEAIGSIGSTTARGSVAAPGSKARATCVRRPGPSPRPRTSTSNRVSASPASPSRQQGY